MQLSGTMVPGKDNAMEQMRRKLDSIEDTLHTLTGQQEREREEVSDEDRTEKPSKLQSNKVYKPKKLP